MLLLPNALEKPARSMIRFGLKHSPNFTKGLYDIYNLYSKGADNKRLRRYAEDVQDLLGSDYISERAAKYHRTSNAVEQINNIDNTTARFSHYPNGLFGRPTINLSPLGINKQFQSPIPILLRAGGMFNPHSRQIIIKRTNNPIQMRQTTYHEASHASDLSNPSKYGINMYDTDIMRGVSD